MIVRALDANGDWTFGNGLGNYLGGQAMMQQNIQTALYEVLGDCFFNLGGGVDWFGFLSSKDPLGLDVAIRAVIMGVDGVTGVALVSSILKTTRGISFSYNAVTVYGTVLGQFQYSIPNTNG